MKLNIRHFYEELLNDAIEQGFLSKQYYIGICNDLIEIINQEKK